MSRYTDMFTRPEGTPRIQLPKINWATVADQSAPSPVKSTYNGANAPLPRADIVLTSWTNAEWQALDYVFLASTSPVASTKLESEWNLYSRNAPASSSDFKLWGYYRLVTIQGKGKTFTVLLFKSGAHLAHSPWIAGLTNLFNDIIIDAQPSCILSLGTAGGANDSQNLGDVPMTNEAHLQVTVKDNTSINYNNKTFGQQNWFPATDLLAATQSKLFLPLNQVVNSTSLDSVLEAASQAYQKKTKQTFSFVVGDLQNKNLDPANLSTPKVIQCNGIPLLTTDTYYIAPGNTNYAALEMDDAVIAYVAGKKGVKYSSVRNISDTLVPSETPSGKTIPAEARDCWSSAVYDQYGLYTSFNGALAAWATIAAASS